MITYRLHSNLVTTGNTGENENGLLLVIMYISLIMILLQFK